MGLWSPASSPGPLSLSEFFGSLPSKLWQAVSPVPPLLNGVTPSVPPQLKGICRKLWCRLRHNTRKMPLHTAIIRCTCITSPAFGEAELEDPPPPHGLGPGSPGITALCPSQSHNPSRGSIRKPSICPQSLFPGRRSPCCSKTISEEFSSKNWNLVLRVSSFANGSVFVCSCLAYTAVCWDYPAFLNGKNKRTSLSL